MSKKILITGGAGFIGSHLTDRLLEKEGNEVTLYDNLSEQVHGKFLKTPEYMNNQACFVKSSVNDYEKFESVIKENEIVFHLAAKVGVGQSMYEINKYIDNNILGLANLLDILVNAEHNVKKV
ncbi:MAG: GDP-mannose 4,6-dehydratase, partial [Promethearchaeota archaeon]